MAERIQDMTQGRPGKLIISFALPLMVGNVFQQLYTLVDAAVVGQVVGVEALAALGAADWINWLVLSAVSGFTQGFSILVSQRFGAGDEQGLRKGVAMSCALAVVIAALVTAASLCLAQPVLRLLNTPDNIIGGSLTYLTICFAGIPVIMLYNLMGSFLRALGDGRTPLYAMLIAAGINIGLDLLFVAVFHWGIAGAAVATVIAQAFSGLFCLNAVRHLSVLRLQRADWQRDWPLMGQLMRLGTPVAFQNAIISVGGLVVQYVINGFGFIFVAGFTATNKLYGLLELAAISYGYSVATFTGQNLGARKYHRIRSGMKASLVMSIATSLCITALMLLFGRHILSLFVSGEPQQVSQVLSVAFRYLRVMSALLPILYLLHIYRSALQGMGDTFIPMLSGIVELMMRVGVALLFPLFMGQDGIYLAEVIAWTGAAALLGASYYRRERALPREDAASAC